MNSVVILLDSEMLNTELSKTVTIDVDGTIYTGKIFLIMTHEDIPQETQIVLSGIGLKTQ